MLRYLEEMLGEDISLSPRHVGHCNTPSLSINLDRQPYLASQVVDIGCSRSAPPLVHLIRKKEHSKQI